MRTENFGIFIIIKDIGEVIFFLTSCSDSFDTFASGTISFRPGYDLRNEKGRGEGKINVIRKMKRQRKTRSQKEKLTEQQKAEKDGKITKW